MTNSRALDAGRLPWLTDSAAPPAKSGGSPLITWGVAALVLVAGGSYWAGRASDFDTPGGSVSLDTAWDTVRLPEPRFAPADAAEQPPKITLAPPPQIELSKPPPAPAIAERSAAEGKAGTARKGGARKSARTAASKRNPASRPVAAKAKARRVPMAAQAWPRPAEAVPLKRVIHIGTYSTPERNHRAWQSALGRYPQMRGLPKITGVYRAANGKIRYPLYIMTAEKTQSDWLCRRLRRDLRSCTIITA